MPLPNFPNSTTHSLEEDPRSSGYCQPIIRAEMGHDAPAQSSSASRAPLRKRRRGGRVYSGCNICRLRKIKCDGRQPTCSNCERSRKYLCDGYKNPSRVPSSPVAIMPSVEEEVVKAAPVSWSEDSMAFEKLLDGYRGGFGNPVNGNGTFLLSQLSEVEEGMTPEARLPAALLEQDIGNGIFLGMPPWFNQEHDIHTEAGGFLFTEDAVAEDVSDFLLPTSPLTQPRAVCAQDETRERGSLAQTRLSGHQGSSPISIPREPHVRISDMSNETIQLINHYEMHVCGLMMPTLAPTHNPYLLLYLPMALQTQPLATTKCLLYTILSVSAFNKAELESSSKAIYRRKGAMYKSRAFELLQACIEEKASSDTLRSDRDIHALMAAALTLTTAEVFSGSDEGSGYEVLRYGKRIVRLTGGREWWLSNKAGVTLLQIFRCLEILACTTSWKSDESLIEDALHSSKLNDLSTLKSPGIAFPERNEGSSGPSMDSSLFCQYSLDVSFGISMITLRCINDTIELCKTKNKLISDGGGWTKEKIEELKKLKSNIYDTFDDPDAFTPQLDSGAMPPLQRGMSDYVSEEIKTNHIWAFHYSAAIFYRRALCNGGRDIVPSIPTQQSRQQSDNDYLQMGSSTELSGQELVSKALEYLENVDALSADIPIANTLWPGFIAAVEAADMPLRHRAMIWFARAKRHGIGNISKAKELVMEVWRTADRQTWIGPGQRGGKQELGPIDWRDVMREKKMYIMLT